MAKQRSRDTSPELAIRSALHKLGCRYRVHARPLDGLRREADIVFTKAKVAVFIDGCFWHRCPQHGTDPSRNSDFWRVKLDRNVERDRETDLLLAQNGWTAIRIWEHEDWTAATARVVAALS